MGRLQFWTRQSNVLPNFDQAIVLRKTAKRTKMSEAYTQHTTELQESLYIYIYIRCCATNRKVAGLIPAGVIGNFIDIKSFRSHYDPGVDSASNRNEYQKHFLEVKAAGA